MAKWITSLCLVLTLCGGVLSGMPLHSQSEECAHGMSGMDCCKKAQGQGNAQEVATARMCCAINCGQPGTSGSSGVQIPKISLALKITAYPVVPPAVDANLLIAPGSQSHGPPPPSNPVYIRNLSLLI